MIERLPFNMQTAELTTQRQAENLRWQAQQIGICIEDKPANKKLKAKSRPEKMKTIFSSNSAILFRCVVPAINDFTSPFDLAQAYSLQTLKSHQAKEPCTL